MTFNIAIYTPDASRYPVGNALILTPKIFNSAGDLEQTLKVKNTFLRSCNTVLIDFIGASDLSPMTFAFGALALLTSGELRQLALVGSSASILDLTTDQKEREAIGAAIQSGALLFFNSAEDWLKQI